MLWEFGRGGGSGCGHDLSLEREFFLFVVSSGGCQGLPDNLKHGEV